MKKIINRTNGYCAYFPCHKGLEDCTFCYCPFYPCGNGKRGRYIITKDRREAWSCEECNWIHKKKVVDEIFSLIKSSNINVGKGRLKTKEIGVIILGHGSKLKAANNTVRAAAEEVSKKSGVAVVEPAYLQLCRPGLSAAIRRAAQSGCKRIIIMPFFLFMGNHVTRDIPNLIKKAAKAHPSIELIYAKNIGQDSRIINIVLDSIREAI